MYSTFAHHADENFLFKENKEKDIEINRPRNYPCFTKRNAYVYYELEIGDIEIDEELCGMEEKF